MNRLKNSDKKSRWSKTGGLIRRCREPSGISTLCQIR
jgi:hypothetical protein